MFDKWWGSKDSIDKSNMFIFGTMLLAGVAGLLSAFVLTVEKFHLLQDPSAKLSCSVNIILNCASVMQTWQASVFGFPNSLLGLMGFSVVITVAIAGLSGVKFPKPFMVAAQIGFGLGLIFAYWLFFQSVFVIQVLCPWCLLVTTATTILFDTLLRYNLRENSFSLSPNSHAGVLRFLEKDYDKFIVAAWLVLMAVVVFLKFGEGLFL